MGLFDERLARKPIEYPWTQEFIEAFWKSFWTPMEFDFKSDLHQFKRELSEQERQIVVKNITAIGQIEVQVKTFWAKLCDHFKKPEIAELSYCLANSEVIHGQAYEKLLDVLGLQKAFEENLKHPVMEGRVQYLKKHLSKVYEDDRKQYVYTLALFTLFIENVSLFSQFYVIMWLRRFKNVLKDTAQQVSYTRLEEDLHAKVGIRLINTLRIEYPEYFDSELENLIVTACEDAYVHECKMIDWIIGDYSGDGLDAKTLHAFVGNRFKESLAQIGYSSSIEIDQELLEKTRWFDEEQYANGMVDFFSSKPVYYAKHNKAYDPEELF